MIIDEWRVTDWLQKSAGIVIIQDQLELIVPYNHNQGISPDLGSGRSRILYPHLDPWMSASSGFIYSGCKQSDYRPPPHLALFEFHHSCKYADASNPPSISDLRFPALTQSPVS